MFFPVKVLNKKHIIREKKTEYVTREKKVLQILSSCNNFFVRLYCTFQDTERLYFVLTYAKNGELLPHINNKKVPFSSNCCQYYAAELVQALEILNSKGIVHRDLKPENILFDENWHVLITDFGSAKIMTNEDTNKKEEEASTRRKNSFVGTAQYVSPEILTDTEATYACDLWAFGCILYQMLCCSPPFQAGSDYLIFQKILKLEYTFPEDFDKAAKDLIEKLLVINPNERLGAADIRPYNSIREHEYFRGIDWNDLGPPPKICLENKEENNKIPDNLEPGLDEQRASLLQLGLDPDMTSTPRRKKTDPGRKITDLTSSEIEQRLESQKKDKWHSFVQGNLILKQGLIDKKKGLFARRRMFLLTMGPHLYYVDPANMVLKGEIPFTADLRVEAKNFKTFFVHTVSIMFYFYDIITFVCIHFTFKCFLVTFKNHITKKYKASSYSSNYFITFLTVFI